MSIEILNNAEENINVENNNEEKEVKKKGRPRKYEGENQKERMYESIKLYKQRNAEKIKEKRHEYYINHTEHKTTIDKIVEKILNLTEPEQFMVYEKIPLFMTLKNGI